MEKSEEKWYNGKMKKARLYKKAGEKIPLEKYKEKIRFLYYEKELSLKDVANEIGVCTSTIRENMIEWNMSRRGKQRKIIKPTKAKLKELYIDKGLTMQKISGLLKVSINPVCKWLHEYNIPIRRFKYKKYNFSGDLKEKAYILGLVAGDISAYKHCRQISVELTTTHPAMMDLFYSTFQKYGAPKKYLKYNKITERYEWKGYVFLDSSFEFMFSKNFEINNNYFYDFLAGFFDSEGCLHIYDNHGYIGLTALIYNSDKKLLEIIKERFEKDGFHPRFSIFFKKGQKTTNDYYRGANVWAIRLHTIKEVLPLMNLMPIKHKEKLDKLKIAMTVNNSNKWEEVSDRVNNLRMKIKKEVKEYINP